jgi:hypothetical protein
MRFPHHARMSVTRRGEKELRLGAFLARGLQAIARLPDSPAGTPPARRAVLAIARSAESPVVKAIGENVRDIAAASGSVRIILVKPGRSVMPAGLAAARPAGLECEVRSARNPRLIEAHEQLVVGAGISWTGDTMRRDPCICDAYESFVEDCPELAAAAAAMFERLWKDCEPLAGDLTAAPVAADAARADRCVVRRS